MYVCILQGICLWDPPCAAAAGWRSTWLSSPEPAEERNRQLTSTAAKCDFHSEIRVITNTDGGR